MRRSEWDIILFKRCLLFENRAVTKQFVVSRKVDKFKLCAHIRLARSPSRIFGVCVSDQPTVCLLYTYTACVFMLMVLVCFYILRSHPFSVCIAQEIQLEWMCGCVSTHFQCNGDALLLPHHTHNNWLRQHHIDFTLFEQSTQCRLVPPYFLWNRTIRWLNERVLVRACEREREIAKDSTHSYKQTHNK